MTARQAFFVGFCTAAALVGAWVYEYRKITARRPYDWSSDPPWPALIVAALAVFYFVAFR